MDWNLGHESQDHGSFEDDDLLRLNIVHGES